jgi:hypothetical protein
LQRDGKVVKLEEAQIHGVEIVADHIGVRAATAGLLINSEFNLLNANLVVLASRQFIFR